MNLRMPIGMKEQPNEYIHDAVTVAQEEDGQDGNQQQAPENLRTV